MVELPASTGGLSVLVLGKHIFTLSKPTFIFWYNALWPA